MPFAPGEFPATIVESILRKVGKKQQPDGSEGTPAVTITVAHEDGSRMDYDLWLTDATWERASETLTKLGWNPEEHDFRFEELNGEALAGVAVNVTCDLEGYTNPSTGEYKEKLKIKWLNVGQRQMDPAEAVDFSAKLRKRFKGLTPQTSKTAFKATTPPPTDVDSNDIPF